MGRIFSLIQNQHGWRRALLSFAIGAVMSQAVAPFYLLPMLVAGFGYLLLLTDITARQEKPHRNAFFNGFFVAWGYIFTGIYWTSFSFLHFAENGWHFTGLLIAGLTAVWLTCGFMATFYGFTMWLASFLWRQDWTRLPLLAAAWSTGDYIRGHILSGFPWNLTSQAFAGSAVTAQPTAILGPYGFGLVIILLSVLPFLGIGRKGRATWLPTVGMAAGLLLLTSFGIMRLAQAPVSYSDTAFLRIVQPNIPQRQKIDPALLPDNFMKSYNMTLEEGFPDLAEGQVLYVVWPENAAYNYFQDYYNTGSGALELVASKFPQNAILLTGAVRIEPGKGEKEHYFNSFHVIADVSAAPQEGARALLPQAPARAILASYDKHHLAPFGEFIPFGNFWRAIGVDRFVPVNDTFSRGTGPTTLPLGHTDLSPIICFETIFAGDMYPKGNRPDWLLTVTNDAWFGDSVGPRQHLDQARMRVIETGLPMARAANTGISAVLGPRGRLLNHLPLETQGRIDMALPNASSRPPYDVYGDWLWLILMLASLGPAAFRIYTQK